MEKIWKVQKYSNFPHSFQYDFIYFDQYTTYRIQFIDQNRFIMSYFYEATSNGNYDKTKKEIQQSIFNLEEKLRRRKQLEVELLRQEEAISRYRPYPYVYGSQAIPYIDPYRLYQQPPLSRNRNYPHSQLQIQRINEDYLRKIDKIQRQKQLLSRQMKIQDLMRYNNTVGLYPYNQNVYLDNNNISDDMLVAKYNDGTKIQQYQDQLQIIKKNQKAQIYQQTFPVRSNPYNQNRKIQVNPYDRNPYQRNQYDKNSQDMKFSTAPKKKLQPEFEENLRTPYQLLKSNHNNHNISISKHKQPAQFYSKPEQINSISQYPQYYEQSKQQKKHVQYLDNEKDNKNSQRYTKSMKKLVKHQQNNITLKPDIVKQIYQKRGVSPTLSRSPNNKLKRRAMSTTKISPYKKQINKYLNNSKLQRSHYINFQADALKSIDSIIIEIQNRLKLSEIVYNDSQYKNLKYQINHLFNTYDNEVKARKQIKQKINNFPSVLKRHGMVVQ